ncbi:MAG: hypothetical protein ABI876_01550 [Bacteroidota bacterium]
MPVSYHVFRKTWENAAHVKFRMEITPAGDLDFDDDFDLDNDTSRVYIDLPEEVQIATAGGPKQTYDKLPWGWPDTGTLDVTINFAALNGVPEMAELMTVLANPYVNGHEFNIPYSTAHFAYQTSTVFRIWSNEGIGDNVDVLYFEGAIRARPPGKGIINNPSTDAASIEIKFTLVDLARLCMETVKTKVINEWMRSNTSLEVRGPHAILYEFIHRVDTLTYIKCNCGVDGNDRFMWFWKLNDIVDAIFALAAQVYRSYNRDQSLTWHITNVRPYDHIKFFRRLYNGSALRGSHLPHDGIYVQGAANSSGSGGYNSEITEGLFHDGDSGDQGLTRMLDAWELMGAWTESLLTKVQVSNYNGTTLDVAFTQIRQNGSGPLVTAPTAFENATISFQVGARSLRSVKYQVPGMEGADKSEHEIVTSTQGIISEESRSMRVLFHNLPKYGDVKNRFGRGRVGGLTGSYNQTPLPDIPADHDHVAVCSFHPYSLWQLYYFDRPNDGGGYLTNAAVPILLHTDTEIYIGEETIPSFTAPFDSWPVYSTGQTSHDPIECGWATSVMDTYIIAFQTQSGLPFAIATVAASLWGNNNLVQYDGLIVDMRHVPPRRLGDIMTIGDGTASAWLPDGADYGDFLNAKGAIVSYEGDIEGTNTAKIDLIAF